MIIETLPRCWPQHSVPGFPPRLPHTVLVTSEMECWFCVSLFILGVFWNSRPVAGVLGTWTLSTAKPTPAALTSKKGSFLNSQVDYHFLGKPFQPDHGWNTSSKVQFSVQPRACLVMSVPSIRGTLCGEGGGTTSPLLSVGTQEPSMWPGI